MLKSIEILTGKSFMFDGIAFNLRPLLNQNITVPFNHIPDDLLMGIFKKHLIEVRNIAQIEQFNVLSASFKREILVEFAAVFRGQENIFATLTASEKTALAVELM